jgi:outer membrane protein TolC
VTRRLALLALAAAGCASPPDRLETAELRPAPRTAALAEMSGGRAPSVLPSEQVAATHRIVADVVAKGGASLEDCVAIAEATHEDLLSADEDRLQAALRRDLANAGILPTFSLTAYAFAEDRVHSDHSSSNDSGSSASSSDNERLALTVRQPIFRGFAEFRAMEAATRSEESKAALVAAMRAALRRSTSRAFFAVLAAEADVRTLIASEELDRTRVEEMKAREENGIARRSEVLLLESQEAQTLASLRRAKTQREVARTVLDQLLGVVVAVPLTDSAPASPPLPTREAAISEAVRSRQELRAADAAARAAESEVEVARAGYWPSVGFVGNWYLAQSGVSAETKAIDWDAQIALDFPFFDGGATRARERTAKSDLRKARLFQSDSLRAIVQDVESALARASADAELLATLERNVQIATENLGLLREEYANGIATNLEVLVAQNVLQQAQLDVERQRLVDRLDHVELDIAVGRTELQR